MYARGLRAYIGHTYQANHSCPCYNYKIYSTNACLFISSKGWSILSTKKNSQAVKKGAALKSLGEKSCEIKSGSQQMAAMMKFFLWISLLFAIASSKASLWLTLIIPLTFIPLLQESLKTAWLYEELNFDCTNDSWADSTQTRNGRYPTLRNIPL